MAEVAVAGVTLRYRVDGRAPFTAVDGVSFTAVNGEIVAIVGPSGSGKSSLLLAVNGLLRPEAGSISVNGRAVTTAGQGGAMVFQDPSLLPWRTVLGNVELGLELKGEAKAHRREIARQGLARVGLGGFERHYPHELSGGMRQRVGLARALAVEPAVLLMDEPFGALDAQTRHLMAAELLRVWSEQPKTILFVTHDIDEAIFLADRVVVMSAGPGRVLDVIEITLPRPRVLGAWRAEQYAEYRDRIWRHLRQEVDGSFGWGALDVVGAQR